MKKTAIFILTAILFTCCTKNDDVKVDNYLSLTTISGWPQIDFKTDYTIQVPVEFKGAGMQGFEGNSFFIVVYCRLMSDIWILFVTYI